ncbi:PIG-L family deacetylase [Pseudomonas sp. N40(2020)]|uniref:PIG-L deacetylase family protein n=1 Tax=Pseudomonas sp. N40(2020) TaxID=2767798 RepID=UPI0016570584|nr:PIG-L family deacetylase [Pseudomonas sp. N40(2020)]MBC8996415.1 PIG-L family deacetylase [Pseudomonas sp. N40(2020)]
MSARKQQLLKAHRRNKRMFLVAFLVALLVIGFLIGWWLVPLLLVLAWVAHEAWFADHLFYRPSDDYRYDFPANAARQQVSLDGGVVRLNGPLAQGETLILELELKSGWLGRWLDPYVQVGDDRQDFERGVKGRRFLNLSGQADTLSQGALTLRGRYCALGATGTLWVMANPDYTRQRVMVIAPHADDAELAAFGLYSRSEDVSIVTLTQGEIEAENFQSLGLDQAAAARLKGRLRSWDSLVIPLWGGVPAERCVQLGYYCLQLPAMAAEPATAFGSRESQESDVRSVRRHNPLTLPADADGQPTWQNLVADVTALLEHYRPEVVVTPHPELDPHSDHVASTQALLAAIALSDWKPKTLLMYANHLHDNDRWPMGPAGAGVALPPAIEPLPADRLWSPLLSADVQLDKAMALAMEHDLQGGQVFKRQLRRWIQHALAGRRWPVTGSNEFFRKAVRRHELFWVRDLSD